MIICMKLHKIAEKLSNNYIFGIFLLDCDLVFFFSFSLLLKLPIESSVISNSLILGLHQAQTRGPRIFQT
jgi:hypothetical protein